MRVWLAIACLACVLAEAKEFRGAQFIAITDLRQFEKRITGSSLVLTSPRISAEIAWDELVVSWNLRSQSAAISVEVKVFYPGQETGWYSFGSWALNPDSHPRASVKSQRDAYGRVDTDTLKLVEKAHELELRITSHGTSAVTDLAFVGLAFCDSKASAAPLEPNRRTWGKTLPVKERSQVSYPEGIAEWCSPTTTSMLLSYWAEKLNRPELDYDVPEVARGVNDPNWPGTGNWPFNTAFAGAHRGIRAYVSRLSDVSELESWIEAGVPVATSVSYGYLKGQSERANGHLVVCIGFDENGDIVVNDPGRRLVRQVYSRANFIKAWAESENTVYLVYPESWKIPDNRFGHWEGK